MLNSIKGIITYLFFSSYCMYGILGEHKFHNCITESSFYHSSLSVYHDESQYIVYLTSDNVK